MAPWWQVWAIQTCRQTAHHWRHPPRALEQTWAAALPMQVQQTPPAVGVPHQLSGMGKPAGPPVLTQQNPRRQLSAGTMPQWQPISSLPPRRIRCQPLRATSPWRQPANKFDQQLRLAGQYRFLARGHVDKYCSPTGLSSTRLLLSMS